MNKTKLTFILILLQTLTGKTTLGQKTEPDSSLKLFNKQISFFPEKKSLLESYKEEYLNKFNSIQGKLRENSILLKQEFSNPIILNQFEIFSEYQRNTGVNALNTGDYFNYGVNLDASAGGIPFQFNYMKFTVSDPVLSSITKRSIQFDKDSYISDLKKKMGQQFNPGNILSELPKDIDQLSKQALDLLKNDLNEVNAKYKGALDSKISSLGELNKLFERDIHSLTNELLSPQMIKEMNAKTSLLNQLQAKKQTGSSVNEEDIKKVSEEIERYRGLKEMISKLEEHKSKWVSSGLVTRIKESGLVRKEMIRKMMNDPGFIAASAKKYLKLNQLQRLFLKMSKLNLGQQTPGLSDLSAGNIIADGLGARLENKNKTLDIFVGSQHSFNSPADLFFVNGNLQNTNNSLLGLRIGKNYSSGSADYISLLASRSIQQSISPFILNNAVPRTSMVLGYKKDLELGKNHHLEIEVSKSSSTISNQENSDSSGKLTVTEGLLSKDNFLGNLAFSLDYRGGFEHIDLDANFRIRFAGQNYYNPSAVFLPAGGNEIAVYLRKSFYKKRLQVMLRSNLREYNFSTYGDSKWSTSSLMADVKWKFKKAQYISLRYQPVRSSRVVNRDHQNGMTTDRISLQSLVSAKIKKQLYRNIFSLTYSNISMPDAIAFSSRTFQFSSNQSVVIGKNAVIWNSRFIRADRSSGFLFMNSSFDSDIGLSYTLARRVNLTSSVSYQSVTGWYQQLGILQSISGELGKNCSLYLFVDAGKSFKVEQPLPYSLVRAECSLHYSFGKQRR